MKRIEEIKKKTYLPFFILFIIFGIYDCIILPCYGDDIVLFTDVIKQQSIGEFLMVRYNSWSSRVVIEAVLVYMVKYSFVWRILNTIISVGNAFVLSKLVSDKHEYAWPCCIAIAMYPFLDMSTAGWIATILNYWWPLGALLVLCYFLKKDICGKNIKWYEYLIAVILAIFACNQEQISAIVLAIFGCILVYEFLSKKKLSIYALIIVLIDAVSMYYILTCPGNITRVQMSGGESYNKFSLIKKIELGLVNIQINFLSVTNYFFIIVLIVLGYMLWKTKKNTKELIFLLPVIIVMFGYRGMNLLFDASKKIFIVLEKSMDFKEYDSHILLALTIFFVILLGMWGCMYQLLKDNKSQFALITLVLVTGVGSAVMLGLSPSVFASDTRIFLFLYMAIIYTMLICYKNVKDRMVLYKYEKYCIYIVIALVLVLQVTYMISNVLGRRNWGADDVVQSVSRLLEKRI